MSAQPSLRVVDSTNEKLGNSQTADNATDNGGPNQSGATAEDLSNNVVAQTIREMCRHMTASHEIRETLLASGVQFHALNMILQLGRRNHHDEKAEQIKKAVTMSKKDNGRSKLTIPELEEQVEQLESIELDLELSRKVARQQDLNVPVINSLVQLIRLNPGDDGKEAINTFVGYAISNGVELDRFRKIASDIINEGGQSNSVLPQVASEDYIESQPSWRSFAQDAFIGLIIAAVVMWMVL